MLFLSKLWSDDRYDILHMARLLRKILYRYDIYNKVTFNSNSMETWFYFGKIVHEMGPWGPSQYKDVRLQVNLGLVILGISSL